jgi:hypothetical protein
MARKIGHTARVTNERCGRKYTIQDWIYLKRILLNE